MSYYGLRSLKFIVSTPNLYLSKEEARGLGAYDETIEVIIALFYQPGERNGL